MSHGAFIMGIGALIEGGRNRRADNEARSQRPFSDRGAPPDHRGQETLAEARNVAADMVRRQLHYRLGPQPNQNSTDGRRAPNGVLKPVEGRLYGLPGRPQPTAAASLAFCPPVPRPREKTDRARRNGKHGRPRGALRRSWRIALPTRGSARRTIGYVARPPAAPSGDGACACTRIGAHAPFVRNGARSWRGAISRCALTPRCLPGAGPISHALHAARPSGGTGLERAA